MSKEKTENEPSLRTIPMLTQDGIEIKLNTVLYRAVWESGYGFKSEGKFEVEALRVFFVNNQSRTFRVRCTRGCESTYKMADGCISEMIYGKVSSAMFDIQQKIHTDIGKCIKKKKQIEATMSHIVQEKKKCTLSNLKKVKIPKPVKESAHV